MKRVQTAFRLGGLFLLIAATSAGVSSSGEPGPAAQTAALQARVEELQTQLDACTHQISTLKAENEVLRRAVAELSNGQPQPLPKGAVPFEFNGMRFYAVPAQSDPRK